MVRLSRLYAPATVHYLLQRPVAGRSLFVDADDCALLVRLLEDAVKAHGVSVHAYALLPEELLLLATPANADAIAQSMQAIGRRYVPHLNRKAGVTGTLWDRRYRSTLIDAERWLLPSMHHIEHRPVALGYVASAADWAWSSHAHHAGLGQQSWIQDHAGYWALGNTPFERQAAYRDPAMRPSTTDTIAKIDEAVRYGWVLGDAAYLAQLALATERRLRPLPRGRRRKDRGVPD